MPREGESGQLFLPIRRNQPQELLNFGLVTSKTMTINFCGYNQLVFGTLKQQSDLINRPKACNLKDI